MEGRFFEFYNIVFIDRDLVIRLVGILIFCYVLNFVLDVGYIDNIYYLFDWFYEEWAFVECFFNLLVWIYFFCNIK